MFIIMNNSRSASARKRTEQPPPPQYKPVSGSRATPQQAPKQAPQQTTSNVRAGQSRQGMSVSDAIGLTTVRLCRVEHLLNLQANQNQGVQSGGGNVVDVSVIGSIVERLERLEQFLTDTESQNETVSGDLDAHESNLSSLRNDVSLILERLNKIEATRPEVVKSELLVENTSE